MTNITRIIPIIMAMMLAMAMVVVAHAQTFPPPGPSTTPQYFTCTEVVPGVSGSNLSHVIVWLRLSNVTTSNGLLYLLDQMYYNVSSPYFHRFITPQEFASWYSPPSSVVSYVVNLAESYGLTVNYTFPMLIEATGTASEVDNFLTALQSAPSGIQQWILSGECIPIGYFHVSSIAPLYRPQYAAVRLNVTNINALLRAGAVNVNGKPMQVIQNQVEIWLPQGLEFIYDELPLFSNGYTGRGLTIAVVDAFGDFNLTLANQYVYQSVACQDLATFNNMFGLPPVSCQVIYPTGTPALTPYDLSTAEGWAVETALDIEYAHTMAPGANILLVISPTAGDDLFTDVEYVVNNSLANFISLSWGAYEDMFYYPPPSYNLLYGYDEVFMQAAAEGIGVFAASGDSGAFDTYWLSLNMTMEPSVSYPASDPWVTSVGGTTLYGNITNTVATRIEYAWNWNSTYLWGSGGGYSFAFPETPGQALIHIIYERTHVYEPDLGIYFRTIGHRGVPDIAADANPFTGVLIVLNGSIFPYLIGGTSLATPLSAGMTATIQSYLYGTGVDYAIGDLAPSLYLLYYRYPSQFYAWSPAYPTSAFSTGIPGAMFVTLGGQNGLYWVIPGQWNPVDGLGQINVYGLAHLLPYITSRSLFISQMQIG
ncbi:S53 family peptidase [Vulcanisaeta distributa]|uniref:Peptidase S53 propeptide n=1 Tax=Vulcanisaeta distributa (strain DSM 14429 / JCM 11212 / NBRC 100878 / IC-017) TaxID=572478 RepID=E1QR72_VULDI|nr:S53 family peptidase [Vulcanisaeta distributa]ADN51762.1 Peptidase S53 propeptide [Vulcanisaeta distributa DSM 14429]